MNNLLNFLVKHVPWFIFTFYVILSCVLLFRNNPYQQSVYLTSANAVTATVYGGISNVTSYFNLKDINEELQQRNAALEMEVINLKRQMADMRLQLPGNEGIPGVAARFAYVPAHVISNSIAKPYNYITIDRGSDDGVYPEMGVVDHNGVVGIVNVVGRHSARVISVLNTYFKLSCKLKSTQFFGTLTWDGKNPEFATLTELPKQGTYLRGDTIITSGYSAMFPEGIIVGYVVEEQKELSTNFISLKVKLASNFMQLSSVRCIKNVMKVELKALESRDESSAENSPEKIKEKERKQKKLREQEKRAAGQQATRKEGVGK